MKRAEKLRMLPRRQQRPIDIDIRRLVIIRKRIQDIAVILREEREEIAKVEASISRKKNQASAGQLVDIYLELQQINSCMAAIKRSFSNV